MTPYSPDFFDAQSRGSQISADAVLGELFQLWRPARVLDVGCGVGAWLSAAQARGVADILGMDGDYVDRTRLLIDPARFLDIDLEGQRLPDVLEPGTRFDLVLCMEVAEHLSYDRAESLVADLAALGDVVLFSAAVPFQGGEHHLNEQWPEFWALLFRQQGFDCADLLRDGVWGRADVEWWYAQNTLVFFRRGSEAEAAFAPHVVPAGRSLARIHPINYLDQIQKWFHTHRFSCAADENADLRALLDAYRSGAGAVPPLDAVARARANPDRADVFPRTRSDRSVPEVLLAEQRERIAALEEQLRLGEKAPDAMAVAIRSMDAARSEFARARADQAALLLAKDAAILEAGREVEELLDARSELEIEHEVLQAAHAELRDGYRAAQEELARASERAREGARHKDRLRDLETSLLATLNVVRSLSPSDRRLEHARALRLVEFYYGLYSRPGIGSVLGRLRRFAGRAVRAVAG